MEARTACHCDHVHELEKAFLVISELNDANSNLQSSIEAALAEGDRKISTLEQEKHDMELKLSRHMKMVESYQDDLEAQQREFTSEKKNAVKDLESKMSERTTKHKLELSNLEADLEKVKIAGAELREENSRLEEVADKLRSQLKAKEMERIPIDSFSDGSSEEVEAYRKENAMMAEENCLLLSKLEKAEEQVVAWRNQSSMKDNELSKVVCESVSYFNENERLKEKIKDLQMELDVERMQSNKKQAKGNSLFSEVEDRRVEVEKQLINIRIENDSLMRQLKLTRDSLNHAKMQLSVKWDVRSAVEYKERLESVRIENTRLLDENRTLNYKLKALNDEEQQMKLRLPQNAKSDVPEVRRYQILFESAEKKLRDTNSTLSSKTMTLYLVEGRLRESETALLSTKQELFDVSSDRDKLKRKMDELLSKYEPENHESKPKPKKVEYHTEKLNFASRKKFQSTTTTGEEEAHNNILTTKDSQPHEVVSVSYGQSLDRSRKSMASNSADDPKNKGHNQHPIEEHLNEHQDKNDLTLSDKKDNVKVIEQVGGSVLANEHNSKNTDAAKKDVVQSHTKSTLIPQIEKHGKENTQISKMSPISEKAANQDEPPKIISLADELAMFGNAPGMFGKNAYISEDDDNDDVEPQVMKESSKTNVLPQQVADNLRNTKDLAIDSKVAASNPAPLPSRSTTYTSQVSTASSNNTNSDACRQQ